MFQSRDFQSRDRQGAVRTSEALPLPLGYRDRSVQTEADACFRGQRSSFAAREEHVAGSRAAADSSANRGAFSTAGDGPDDRPQGRTAADLGGVRLMSLLRFALE